MSDYRPGLVTILVPILTALGCVSTETPSPTPKCVDSDDPAVHIVGHDDECARIRFSCDEGQVPFRDECSCGCIDEPGDTGSADAFFDCFDSDDPSVHYVGSVEECAAIRFACSEDQEMFFDDCGCGCLDLLVNPCHDADDPAVHYLGDTEECTRIRFACEDGQEPFWDECGCGCIDEEPIPPGDDCLDPDDPSVHYVGTIEECAVIRFGCDSDQEMFFDDCGCGCVDLSLGTCHDADDPAVHYVSDVEGCTAIRFVCEDDQSPFWDDCGCGCIDDILPTGCHDPDDPTVTYMGDLELCARIRFVCEEGEEYFADDCGCGCVDL